MSDDLKPASQALCIVAAIIAMIVDIIATVFAFMAGVGPGLAFLFLGSPILGVVLYWACLLICGPIVYLIEKPRASSSASVTESAGVRDVAR